MGWDVESEMLGISAEYGCGIESLDSNTAFGMLRKLLFYSTGVSVVNTAFPR